ncbi:hypothetical protein FHS52_001678 [Erythromicrobium ramosum]|uniref:Uncharacterized protein n=1 Tax=Erythrobacter ramosus TaxID=35811 RepID=A0A6I4UN31_9SPHN|nr:hypothetical protein [Erythrobacter ramosus]MBB3775709.1 hypothetical protein [Erythrobacter ramosus]MXP39194.1 hypothetical protein [Erythrobacter ramosus]
MDNFVPGLISGLFGLAIYIGLVFWAGRKRWWWLALLVSLPAIMAGMMSAFIIDMSRSSNPLFQNFGWLVLGQLTIGIVTYLAGRIGSRPATEK